MAYAHIIDTTATTVESGPVKSARVTVGTGLTGTITVVDNTTGSTPVVAIITNPVVGNEFNFGTLKNGFRIIASGACDITATTIPA